MKCRLFFALLLTCVGVASEMQGGTRVITRVNGGLNPLQNVCGLLACNVAEAIGDPQGQLFLVTSLLPAPLVQSTLCTAPAVLSCELDQQANIAGTNSAPPALTDSTPTNYYGQTVPHGYSSQPATAIIRLSQAQITYGVTGSGIVAVIDTGVDPNHPALRNVLLPGYDFTRNQPGADETQDAQFSQSPSTGSPASVNSQAVANVDQSTAAVVDGSGAYSDFGHGTMVTGIIHLIAPSARILPLKAFKSDGTGNTSDILRAIYMAVNSGARVINMSFDFTVESAEVKRALQYANGLGVIAVAAAGNQAQATPVYPAGYSNLVMGIASTTNNDQLSSFSNYGPALVWVGAPGEGVVTTYPFGLYAAGWGTSFSAPMVSGTASLLLQIGGLCDQYDAALSVAHAIAVGSEVGSGRLDVSQAVQAWAADLGWQ